MQSSVLFCIENYVNITPLLQFSILDYFFLYLCLPQTKTHEIYRSNTDNLLLNRSKSPSVLGGY